MRRIIASAVLLVLANSAGAQAKPKMEPELKWGPAPEVFPSGAQMAVLKGDPTKPGNFTVRLKMPAGYIIPPHWHPTNENISVVSGTFLVGMGKLMDTKTMKSLPAGGSIVARAKEPHYAMTKGETVVQVRAKGPFAMTYVK